MPVMHQFCAFCYPCEPTKCKGFFEFAHGSTGQGSVLSAVDEAVIVETRRKTLLPLDDLRPAAG